MTVNPTTDPAAAQHMERALAAAAAAQAAEQLRAALQNGGQK